MAKHKQADQDPNNLKSEGSVFFTAVAALQLSCPVPGKLDIIIWKNPAPGSKDCCRPLHLQNEKETKELTIKEVAATEAEIAALKPTEVEIGGRKVTVSHHLTCCMVDGKVVSTVLESSMQSCNVCGAKPSEMNNIEKVKTRNVNPAALRFGVSPLHAVLRFFSLVLALAVHLPLKKSRCNGARELEIMNTRKREIQRDFQSEMQLLVDVPKSGGVGTSTTGNTARIAFEQYEKTAKITGVDCDLLKRFSIVLQVLRSQFAVDVHLFEKYANDTAELYANLYKWYYMPSSVHKVLIHGAQIMAASPVPLGMLTEECQESRNHDIKWYKLYRSFRGSEKIYNMQVFQRLLLSSDPVVISYKTRKLQKSGTKPISKEVLEMLLAPEAN